MKIGIQRRLFILATLAMLGLFFITCIAVRNTTQEFKMVLQERSLAPVVAMIESAYREKDDLALQKILRVLMSTPEIISARIVDDPKEAARGSWTIPLQDREVRWGFLSLKFTNAAAEHFNRQIVFWGLSSAGGFILIVALQAIWGFRQGLRLQQERDDATAVGDELREALAQVRREHIEHQAVATRCLESALEQIPRPCLLLDHQQRVMGFNLLAVQFLGFASSHDLMGTSWQDLPGFADCGRLLTESLENPKRTFRTRILNNRVTLDLWTLESVQYKTPGTWATFYPTSPLET